MIHVLSCAFVEGVHVPFILLSCSLHLPFIFLSFSFDSRHGSFIFLSLESRLSAEALKWSHNPQKHVLCFLFGIVFSWKRFSFVSCCLHSSLMLLFISLSCSLHFFPLHVFHVSPVVLSCRFIFRSFSYHFPIIFLISRWNGWHSSWSCPNIIEPTWTSR